MKKVLFIIITLTTLLFSKELDKVSVQLQWLDQFQFAGYYIAKEKGYYKEAGLEVEIKKYKHGMNVVDEVLKGNATFGVGRSSLIVDKSRGAKINILSSIFQSSPLILLARADSGITTIKSFKNKRIMGNQDVFASLSLHAMMNKSNIDQKQLIKQEHSFDIEDLINKKTDLMASYISNEPYKMIEKGVKYRIFDPKDYGFDFYSDILFTNSTNLKHYRQKVRAFTKATLKGWEYAFENIEECASIIHKKYNSQKKSLKSLIYEGKELKKLAFYKTQELGYISLSKIQRIYDIYNIMGLIENEIDINEFIMHEDKYNSVNLTLKELKYLKENPVLKIHNEKAWPPFNYIDEDGLTKGFAIDYMALLASKIGIDIKFINGYTWSQFMDMLQSDKLDLIINIVKTEERSKNIAFTKPYYKTQNVIYVHENNQNFESLQDLEYQTIAMPKSFFTQKYLEKNHPNIKQVLVKNQLEALKLLSLGKVDATIGKKVVMEHIIAQNNIASVIPTKYIDEKKLISPLRIGASKEDQLLIDILIKAQNKITDYEYRKLVHKWFGLDKKKNLLTNKEKKYIKNKKSIKMCINNTWAPIEFLNQNEAKGISIDAIKILEKKLNTNFELVKTKSWSQSQEYLRQRKCDILPTAIKTKERLKYANFTTPYLKYDLAIITTKDKPLIASLDSISEKKTSRNKGSGLISKLKELYPNIDIKETKSHLDSLKAVSNNEVYYTISTLPVFSYLQNRYHLENIHVAGYTNIKYNLCIAVRNDDPLLFSILNKSINQLTDETLNVIYEKWANETIIENIDYTLIGKILFIFSIIIFIIIFFMIKQNKLKQTIENQKETFENLYRKSTDGIVLIEDGKFIDCNESILKMLGFKDKEQFLNIDPSKLSPKYQPDGKTSFKKRSEMIDIALKEGSNSFEWIHIKADGSEFWAEIVLTKININDKDIIHLVLRDIEKRKKAEEELSNLNEILELKVKEEVEKNRQKDKQMLAQSRLAQMGEMISMIAHQWRQPLTAIGSTAINLKFKLELESYDLNKKEDRKECEEYFINELNDIEKYTHNLTTTIEDFRNFYKPNKEYKALSIKKPLEIALNIIKGSLDSNNIKLTTQFESVNIINMYDSELMQVFLNILKNAQDSFKEQHIENKQIIIKTKDLEDGINISIFNNGTPIKDDVLPKIFDPYFSTKLEKNGTGLGLYMSKTIIEEHHKGKIEAVNHTDGVAFEIIIRSV